MTNEQKQLYKRIDEILWNDWDPIGVNDTENVRDEYYSYIPHIFGLITEGANTTKIAEHLYKIETINMGLSGNMEHCKNIAQKIVEARR